jgi:multiple antibiotic resistance protein
MSEYIKLLVALVAIIDIVGNIPIFLQQTGNFSSKERLATAAVASVTTFGILIVFALFGQIVLSSFGISIAAFKVLGGIVVLLIALDLLGMMRSDGTIGSGDPGFDNPFVVGVFPLAVPLFAGPGAITAVMVYAHESHHQAHTLLVMAVIASACIALLIGLSLASSLGLLIGPVSQIVMNRILGMVVGALGVEFILEGILEFFPFLTGA